MNGTTLLLLLLGGIAFWAFTGQSRASTGHSHGGSRQTKARHEAGHVAAARGLGARVTDARIDGAAGVKWTGSRGKTSEQIAADVITFMAAGRIAAGTGRGCSADEAAIREQLSYLPRGDRARVRAAAERHARQIVSSRSGEVRRVAAKLERDGRL